MSQEYPVTSGQEGEQVGAKGGGRTVAQIEPALNAATRAAQNVTSLPVKAPTTRNQPFFHPVVNPSSDVLAVSDHTAGPVSTINNSHSSLVCAPASSQGIAPQSRLLLSVGPQVPTPVLRDQHLNTHVAAHPTPLQHIAEGGVIHSHQMPLPAPTHAAAGSVGNPTVGRRVEDVFQECRMQAVREGGFLRYEVLERMVKDKVGFKEFQRDNNLKDLCNAMRKMLAVVNTGEHTHANTCICTHTHARTHTHEHTNTQTQKHTNTHTHKNTITHAHTQTCLLPHNIICNTKHHRTSSATEAYNNTHV